MSNFFMDDTTFDFLFTAIIYGFITLVLTYLVSLYFVADKRKDEKLIKYIDRLMEMRRLRVHFICIMWGLYIIGMMCMLCCLFYTC